MEGATFNSCQISLYNHVAKACLVLVNLVTSSKFIVSAVIFLQYSEIWETFDV